ncbi:MAG: hypothetical protein A2607_01180 [Candidatus Vogelbacteria bacterium RIFOXYD1_FULL_42_15]|uniref:PseI/NeuA/B-like domain-containing protein n=1 Tax=Candidatus Vogelbacteria bacterium RIFOXYD1_FULL_42_15 TaxID=1802437 RepID=A0A1G2QHB2_9BACT|nr:MAG: hypothetical protein A2607_01180 [Candidatus Vogelbacteria bacterium RIFOXYD1_FULL_42_15]
MVTINGRRVGQGYPVFFIAEIGINHNGSLPMALEMVEKAVSIGVEAVKFQKRDIATVFSPAELDKERDFDRSIIDNARERTMVEGKPRFVLPEKNWQRLDARGPTTNGDLKYALEFTEKDYDLINRQCLKLGVSWSASAWDGLSAHFINGFEDVAWLKVASACLTNRDLLLRVKAKGKPIFMSTGGSTLEQVGRAVEVLGPDNLVLLHCVSEYPPRDEDSNLMVMETLKRIYPQVPIGYSSHSRDIFPPLVATMLGACAVEVHLTLDRNLPGSDHQASLEPSELAELVRQVRRFETLRGDGVKRVLPGECATMAKLRRVDDL